MCTAPTCKYPTTKCAATIDCVHSRQASVSCVFGIGCPWCQGGTKKNDSAASDSSPTHFAALAGIAFPLLSSCENVGSESGTSEKATFDPEKGSGVGIMSPHEGRSDLNEWFWEGGLLALGARPHLSLCRRAWWWGCLAQGWGGDCAVCMHPLKVSNNTGGGGSLSDESGCDGDWAAGQMDSGHVDEADRSGVHGWEQESVSSGVAMLRSCRHAFHSDCLHKWLKVCMRLRSSYAVAHSHTLTHACIRALFHARALSHSSTRVHVHVNLCVMKAC